MLRDSYFQEYYNKAQSLALVMANNHSDRLSSSNRGGKIVSMGVSILDGFMQFSSPLSLHILCHPANLYYTDSVTNKSFIDIDRLKSRIHKFETKYGNVKFPKGMSLPNKVLSNTISPIVLGLDPGPKNFGVYVGRHYIEDGELVGIDVHHSSMLYSPITSIKSDVNSSLRSMLGEIQYYYQTYEPDSIVIERFQARGFKGAIVELVNIMVGAIISHAYDVFVDKEVSICTPTPAIWKNQVNRVASLDLMYKKCRDIGPHRLDASLLSLYALEIDGNPYTIFQDDDFTDRYIEALNCK